MHKQQLAKLFNLICGLMFVLIGLVGIFWPEPSAQFLNLLPQNIEGQTEIRAISGFSFAVGYLLIHFAWVVGNQRPVLLALAVLMLGFIIPRMIGLGLDGLGQPLILKELTFEVAILIVALWLASKK